MAPYTSNRSTEYLCAEDDYPAAGSFVWLNIPDNSYAPQPGQAASSLSPSTVNSSMIGAFNQNTKPHLALVSHSKRIDMGVRLSVYLVLTLSKRSSSAGAKQVSELSQRLLLPLPHVRRDHMGGVVSMNSGYRAAATPEGFDWELDCGEWLHHNPAWLWVKPFIFELREDDQYFTLNPPAAVPLGELGRICAYAQKLYASNSDRRKNRRKKSKNQKHKDNSTDKDDDADFLLATVLQTKLRLGAAHYNLANPDDARAFDRDERIRAWLNGL